jgi:hypothetical protein
MLEMCEKVRNFALLAFFVSTCYEMGHHSS